VSKLFNPHLSGSTAAFAEDSRLAQIAGQLLATPDADVFQSMFILKNSGAWGQPWHQDSFYFNFDPQPQLGAWLAITEATLTNGCLWVLPGSHRTALAEHAPDRRPGANQGYLEIEGLDDGAAVPVTMQPGDLLLFHSFLKHRSSDNTDTSRRAAMVLHYAPAGVRNLAPPDVAKRQAAVTAFRPVLRGGAPAAARVNQTSRPSTS
jgi:ectoine hydroxylase-related dioxygenase (phytanoyl-CoA dioxygenase family)